MATYNVTMTGPAVAWFRTTVEADSAEEAIELVKSGEDEEVSSRQYDWDWDGDGGTYTALPANP